MTKHLEVTQKELRRRITIKKVPKVKGTDPNVFIGQERGLSGLEFFLDMAELDTNQYNCYVSGHQLRSDNDAIVAWLEERVAKTDTPDDQLLVHDFEHVPAQTLLSLPAGKGSQFEDDFTTTINNIKLGYANYHSDLMNKSYDRVAQAYNQLEEDFNKIGLILRTDDVNSMFSEYSSTGQLMMKYDLMEIPESMDKEEYKAKLSEIEKTAEFSKAQTQFSTVLQEVQNKLTQTDSAAIRETVVDSHMTILRELNDYIKAAEKDPETNVKYFLDQIREHLPQDLEKFVNTSTGSEATQLLAQLQSMQGGTESPEGKYRVNVLVDNSETKGAPIIIPHDHSYDTIIGTAKGAQFGPTGQLTVREVNHMDFEVGALVEANGGYIALDAQQVLMQPGLLEDLLNTIEEGTVEIDAHGALSHIVHSRTRSVPLNADARVVLFGDAYLGEALEHFVPEYARLFRSKAQFSSRVNTTDERIKEYAHLIATISANAVPQKKLTKAGIEAIIEAGIRDADNKEKISANGEFFEDIILRGAREAARDKQMKISREHIEKALADEKYMRGQFADTMSEYIAKEIIKIDTDGKKVGHINGLAVYGHDLGIPMKITVRRYLGSGSVHNIEDTANMSGDTHIKSVEILKSLIKGELTDDELPFAVSASIAFEQNYGGIDGDSATLAQLVAMISAISGLGVKQNYAITGSANQYGDAQVIGGVNLKVEGFYRACKELSNDFSNKAADGYYAAVIPNTNVSDLMLHHDVVDAVEKGHFKVFKVHNYQEACELMMGESWETIQKATRSGLEHMIQLDKKYDSSDDEKEPTVVKEKETDVATKAFGRMRYNPVHLGKIADSLGLDTKIDQRVRMALAYAHTARSNMYTPVQ